MRRVKSQFIYFLIVLGAIVITVLCCLLISALLFTYWVPFWNHTEIDSGDIKFSEFVGVNYFSTKNLSLTEDNLILVATDGTNYSFYQNNWNQMDEAHLNNFKPSFRPGGPCDNWMSPPPITYLRKTRDTHGIEFEHAIGLSSRCYVILSDGSLHTWTRNISGMDILVFVQISLIVGVLLGGTIGIVAAKRWQKRRVNHAHDV